MAKLRLIRVFPLALLLLVLAGSARGAEGPVRLTATISPLAAILDELTTGRAEVARLLPTGASPHTFAPRPSDLRRLQGAVLFYVAPQLDGWAARLAVERRVEVLGLLPAEFQLPFDGHSCSEAGHDHGHDHGEGQIDPHFWTDPLAVAALLPPLTRVLVEIDPEGAEAYRSNARRFEERLRELDGELTELLAPVRGRAVVLFHPSLRYMLRRYGLEVAAVIEPAPGRRPTIREMMELSKGLRAAGARAIFSEPQLPRQSAEALAAALELPLHELDPLGGGEGRRDLISLLRYNARVLREALE